YTQRISAVKGAVGTFHYRDVADMSGNGRGNIDGQDIVDLHLHELAYGGVDLGELGHQFDVGAAHLARKLVGPALVDGLHGVILQGPDQQIAHRFNHGVGQ